MQINPVIVGAGITGSGNTGELAYFRNNTTITGTPGIIVTSIAGWSKLGFGASPGTTYAINIDASSYSNNAITIVNAVGPTTITMVCDTTGVAKIRGGSSTALQLGANALAMWTINNNAAGTTELAAQQNTARIIGGATSLSLRNNANNADNVLVTDAGAVTLRGILQLGSAYVGGVVAATGTIAIKDSTGTTYNMLVHT